MPTSLSRHLHPRGPSLSGSSLGAHKVQRDTMIARLRACGVCFKQPQRWFTPDDKPPSSAAWLTSFWIKSWSLTTFFLRTMASPTTWALMLPMDTIALPSKMEALGGSMTTPWTPWSSHRCHGWLRRRQCTTPFMIPNSMTTGMTKAAWAGSS